MAQIFMYVILVFAFFGLSGCTTGVVAAGAGTSAYVANQEQTLTRQAKDLHVKANIEDEVLRQKFGYFKDIEIFVEDGEVLLLGVVKSPSEKRKLQNIAINQKYVKKIYNKILVDRNYKVTTYANDMFIANMIRTRMIASRDTYLSKLNVEVFKNRVYVFGTVSDRKEKAVAEYLARTGKGVQSVYSYIRVK
tara:strand:- start:4751 stop:5326 length:576 start_codon:yes stop_codon:yes gene_type:complete